MTETAEKPRIDHRQALADYLALGNKRSLAKLHQRYTETAPNPTSIDTLKYWSRKFGWRKVAAEHDDRIAGQVVDRIEETAVERQFDQAAELLDIVEGCVAALKAYAGGPENLKKITTAAEFAQVSNAVVNISKHLELLAGRATRRDDGTFDIRCPDWLAERLAPEPDQDHDGDADPASVH